MSINVLPDIQDQPDDRGIEIDAVGVSDLRYPINFSDGELTQQGMANVSMWVSLPADRKGTHMSRMVELVHEYLQDFDPRTLPILLKAICSRLEVERAGLTIRMPFALQVTSPVSQLASWQAHDLALRARMDQDTLLVESTVVAEVTSLCPCSKAVSDYGAHNQRSRVTLTVMGDLNDPYPLPVREAAGLARQVGSCAVYPLIKRVDERAITMMAYDRPAFVEDMARDLSRLCRNRGLTHDIEVQNLESIHGHDASARISWRPHAPSNSDG